MIKDITALVEELNKKIAGFPTEIANTDITTKDYGVLLENFALTLNILGQTTGLLNTAIAAAKAQKEGENKDESNN
jgi:hypothetical protein